MIAGESPHPQQTGGVPTIGNAAVLFLCIFIAYYFSPIVYWTDSVYTLLVSDSILTRGTMALDWVVRPAIPLLPDQWPGMMGRFLPYQLEVVYGEIRHYFPPGPAWLSLPYVAVCRALGFACVSETGQYLTDLEMQQQRFLAALLTAAAVVLLHGAGRRLLPARGALAITLLFAFGTQLWSTASRAVWSETWSVLLTAALVHHLVAVSVAGRPPRGWWVALLLAAAYACRPTNALPIVAVGTWLALRQRRALPPFLLVGIGCAALFLWYSQAVYASWLPSYYRAGRLSIRGFDVGFFGNLLSPSRGVLWFLPFLPFLGMILWKRRNRMEPAGLAALSATICVGLFVACSAFPHWFGGHSYGPRILTGMVPWLFLLAVLAVRAGLPASRRWRWVAAAACAAAVAIHGMGAAVRRTAVWNEFPLPVDAQPERVWDWRRTQWLPLLPWEPASHEFYELPPYRPIDAGDGAAGHYYWKGWGRWRGPVRWAVEPRAEFLFATTPRGPMEFLLRAQSPAGTDLRASLNGSPVDRWTAAEDIATTRTLRLPGALLRRQNRLTLETLNPEAAPRWLGLHGFELRRGWSMAEGS